MIDRAAAMDLVLVRAFEDELREFSGHLVKQGLKAIDYEKAVKMLLSKKEKFPGAFSSAMRAMALKPTKDIPEGTFLSSQLKKHLEELQGKFV